MRWKTRRIMRGLSTHREGGFFTLEVLMVIWLLSWIVVEYSMIYQEVAQIHYRQREESLLLARINSLLEEARHDFHTDVWDGEEEGWFEEFGTSERWYHKRKVYSVGNGLYRLEVAIEGEREAYDLQTFIFLPPPLEEHDGGAGLHLATAGLRHAIP